MDATWTPRRRRRRPPRVRRRSRRSEQRRIEALRHRRDACLLPLSMPRALHPTATHRYPGLCPPPAPTRPDHAWLAHVTKRCDAPGPRRDCDACDEPEQRLTTRPSRLRAYARPIAHATIRRWRRSPPACLPRSPHPMCACARPALVRTSDARECVRLGGRRRAPPVYLASSGPGARDARRRRDSACCWCECNIAN